MNKEALSSSVRSLLRLPQNADDLSLAARHSPLIKMDTKEPFRPQVVGYTIIHQNGPSPSFPRRIQLSAFRGASLAIEYAVWWDWDINHLYELEHVWVYIDANSHVVGIEGSWHGSIKALYRNEQIVMEGSHPVVLAAPGKHAVDSRPDGFQDHEAIIPGLTSRYAGSHGTTQVDMFAGEIDRTPVTDRYVHSYLTRLAFEPVWDFGLDFAIDKKGLVPWPALKEWIPGRISLWMSLLKQEIGPEEYRCLRTAACSTIEEIQEAADQGMDMVMLKLRRGYLGLPTLANFDTDHPESNLLSALRACYRARIGVYMIIQDRRLLGWVKRLLRYRDWSDYLMTGSADTELLAEMKSDLPYYRTVYIHESPSNDALEVAVRLDASYLHVMGSLVDPLTEELIEEAHDSYISMILGPLSEPSLLRGLSKLSVDVIVCRKPEQFQEMEYHFPGEIFI